MQAKEQKKSPIKQRILHFADSLGISKRDFYKIIDVSRGTLESNSSITEEILAKVLANFEDLSPLWLLTGEGNMLKSTSNAVLKTQRDLIQQVQDPQSEYGCKLCKEKDERIKDLQKMILFQSDTINAILQQIEPTQKQDSDQVDTIGTKTG
jgi:hypothetical protein